MSQLGIVGCGSIGSVLARGFDAIGHRVHVNDVNPEATQALDLPVKSKAWLADNCEYVLFALPTPTTETGGDAAIVGQALESFQTTDATLILRSTMPPGSTQLLADRYDLPLVYAPEFLRDRSDVSDFFNPCRVVLAGPTPGVAAAKRLFTHPRFGDPDIITCEDYLTAELAKEAHNAFFATKVSFANQMRMVCEREGADPETVMDVVTADERNTDSHLDPMLGPYGGKCLPKDTKALRHYADRVDVPTPLLDGTIQTNQQARELFDNVTIEGNWPNVTVGDEQA